MFLSANAGKRSLALSLRDPRGREALLRLADGADVFLQSLRPGLADELGLGPDALRARNPRLVYCSVGAYGQRRAARARARLRRADAGGRRPDLDDGRARPAGRPRRLVADRPGHGHLGGARRPRRAARARAHGEGAVVDVSLYETALGYIGYHLAGYLADGTVPAGRGHALPDGRAVPGLPDARRRADDRRRQRPALRRDLRRRRSCPSSSTTRASATNPDRVAQPRRALRAPRASGCARTTAALAASG